MLKWSLLLAYLFLTSTLYSQNQEMSMKQKIYRGLVKVTISHSVDEIWPEDVMRTDQVFLDARAENEFKISRIEKSIYVGYDDFEMGRVDGVDKDAEIIVYCSIGYRSEKIAEKLIEAGYSNIKNLNGGLTEWINAGLPVVDSTGNETNRVHGYSKLWGKWYNEAEVVYDD